MLRNARMLWVAAGWAMVAAIVLLSLMPSPPSLEFEQSDKLGHFGAYAVLMFWFSQLYGKLARVFYAVGFIAMGVGLEFAQGETGFRTYDTFDMYANALGVVLGGMLGFFWRIQALSSAH